MNVASHEHTDSNGLLTKVSVETTLTRGNGQVHHKHTLYQSCKIDEMTSPTLRSRIHTAFLGLAVTDALGGPLEFQPRHKDPSTHATTMLPNKTFNLPPGHFTDDTSMALCLSSSLLESNGHTDASSQAAAYVRWFREGWMSSVPGKCFDIGVQTSNVLTLWEKTLAVSIANDKQIDTPDQEEPKRTLRLISERFSGELNCGNGSLMRVLPCALVSTTEAEAIKLARESSAITHPHPRCADACAIYTSLVFHALQGRSKPELMATLAKWITGPEHSKIDQAIRSRLETYASVSSFEQQPESQISSSGYVVDTLEAALWAFFSTDSFRTGAIRVVNLGNDADTVGAVYGGLAGASYGQEEHIPAEWLDEMKELHIVREISDRIVRQFHTDE